MKVHPEAAAADEEQGQQDYQRSHARRKTLIIALDTLGKLWLQAFSICWTWHQVWWRRNRWRGRREPGGRDDVIYEVKIGVCQLTQAPIPPALRGPEGAGG